MKSAGGIRSANADISNDKGTLSRKVVRVLDVPVLDLEKAVGKSGSVIQGVETSELAREAIGSGSKKSL